MPPPVRPSLVAWSRIEPLPATADLEPGLRAEVADPLWLLARQWQLGELHGEDAGSPVLVSLTGRAAALDRFLAGRALGDAANRAVDVETLGAPLEPAVEAEAARGASLRLGIEGGLHFLRLLDAAGLTALRRRYLDRYAEPADAPPLDPPGETLRRLVAGGAFDGRRLAADLEPLADAAGELLGLPAEPPVPGSRANAVRRVAERWLGWWRGLVFEPDRPSAWDPTRLEYAFAVQATVDGDRLVLAAEEYAGGRLDWYSFEVVPGATLGESATPVATQDISAVTLPTAASFPGMPADRLWQFEDARVFLGRVDAGPTDLGRILLVEFALAFGNDWYVAPLELLTGSVFRLTSLVVRDTFGVETPVPPSRDLVGQRWNMFSLLPPGASASVPDVFFLPPTLSSTLNGEPVEEVALFRDEMANLVWGVERVVAGPSGERVDRAREVGRVPLRQAVPGDLGDAQIVYRLMTPVPDHWILFVPVPASGVPAASGAIELERRAILRFRAGDTSDVAHPRGLVLRADPAAAPADDILRLAEEEVPRSGVVVHRLHQLARTPSGATVLWLGRDKRTGRGEGASGMRFDTADPPA